jgi:hypothetical protein
MADIKFEDSELNFDKGSIDMSFQSSCCSFDDMGGRRILRTMQSKTENK